MNIYFRSCKRRIRSAVANQNRPTECSECKTLVLSYNMKEHYRISHPEIQTCPHEISQEEIKKALQS